MYILLLKALEYTQQRAPHVRTNCWEFAACPSRPDAFSLLALHGFACCRKRAKIARKSQILWRCRLRWESRSSCIALHYIACRVVCIHLVFSVTKVYNSTTAHNTSWHLSHTLHRQTIKKIIRHFATLCLQVSGVCKFQFRLSFDGPFVRFQPIFVKFSAAPHRIAHFMRSPRSVRAIHSVHSFHLFVRYKYQFLRLTCKRRYKFCYGTRHTQQPANMLAAAATFALFASHFVRFATHLI